MLTELPSKDLEAEVDWGGDESEESDWEQELSEMISTGALHMHKPVSSMWLVLG